MVKFPQIPGGKLLFLRWWGSLISLLHIISLITLLEKIVIFSMICAVFKYNRDCLFQTGKKQQNLSMFLNFSIQKVGSYVSSLLAQNLIVSSSDFLIKMFGVTFATSRPI